jgi:hypothetical protein
MPYRLNHNFGAKDTMHIEHPFERCNTDDAEDMETVDDETAAALIAIGGVELCRHCRPFADAD